MQINLSSINVEVPKIGRAQIQNWALGEILEARVIGRDGTDAVRLRINNLEVRAATPLPLRVGDNLSVTVTRLTPVVTLKPRMLTQAPEKVQLRTALSQSLPKQRSLAPILTQLATVAKSEDTLTHASDPQLRLPSSIVQSAQRVLQAVPDLAQFTDGTQLSKVLRRVGIFTESNIAQARAPKEPELDFKWQLLRLRAALRPQVTPAVTATPQNTAPPATPSTNSAVKSPVIVTAPAANATIAAEVVPPERTSAVRVLSQLVDSAIAKVETNQLKAVSAILDGDFQIAMDLPIKVADSFHVAQLKILKEQAGAHEDAIASTTFVLEIPINDDASLRAVLTQSTDNLAIRLWSSDPELRQKVSTQRDVLAQRLAELGVDNVTVSMARLKPFEQWGKKLDTIVDVRA